ncbi:MAG: serine/threonine protein kinase [Planctomycetes bacterium]|nr:serine/threonine protein kinase [Planctomycetota bacterium]
MTAEGPTTASNRAGELIGERWRLQREIGHGTTGRVWLAWDEFLEREVAIKILEAALGDREMQLRFEREIRVTARLQHPGICTVFEHARDAAGRPCYVMTLARGRDLDRVLEELRQAPQHWRSWPLVDRLTTFLQLLDVMQYAHSQGVVHRDLKPANIVLGRYGELWVLDWGLARDLHEELTVEAAWDAAFAHAEQRAEQRAAAQVRSDAATLIMDDPETETRQLPTVAPVPSSRLSSTTRSHASDRHSTAIHRRTSARLARSTHFGQILGSPAYMSPEQALGRSSIVDKRSDVYSLGCILVELMSLHSPQEMRPGEALIDFIARIRRGERQTLRELWPEAPSALLAITECALARDPQDRYPDCERFALELRALLNQVSESYARQEAERLARERAGAWRSIGRWDFAANPEMGPFSVPPLAWCGEEVGQVHHPELGGLLLGGYGLQIYPLAIEVGDDVRLSIEADLIQGQELWILTRGIDPTQCYQFRYGAYEGRWLAICRARGAPDPHAAELLTMRPLREGETTTRLQQAARVLRLTVECEGQALRLRLESEDALIFRDINPISVAPGRTLAIATWKTQAVIRSIAVERRHAPLMVPSYRVGDELLRLGMSEHAERWYARFLAEHPDSELAPEAAFLRCMAIAKRGDLAVAAEALRSFLAENIEHELARDAIFVLAKVQYERHSSSLRAAIRELLGYQESGDVVRTRFCLWIMPLIGAQVAHGGITAEVENDLEQLTILMRGSPDETAILATLARWLAHHLRLWLNTAVDRNDAVAIAACRVAMRRLRELGLNIGIREPRLLADYARLARELQGGDDPGRTIMVIGRGEERPTALFDFVRDSLAFVGLGAGRAVLAALEGEDPTPVERVLRACLRRRIGLIEGAREDLDWCFRLTDELETSRTSLTKLFAARLGCLAQGYLPAGLVLEGLETIRADLMHAPLAALTAFTCETFGDPETARRLWRQLAAEGTGFALIARQGLERLG